jgi:hypothetical protein
MKVASNCAMFTIGAASLIAGSAFSADFPKEGRYDFTACWSGNENVISFSKTHSATSFEIVGTTRSNPPGGMFDNHTFRCIGANAALDGKNSGISVCEAVDSDGDKRLTYFSVQPDGKLIREHVTGTGKYVGLVTSGSVNPLGPFPTLKPGTVQNCNHQTGTYKLK